MKVENEHGAILDSFYSMVEFLGLKWGSDVDFLN